MANRKAVVVNSGRFQQIQTGDALESITLVLTEASVAPMTITSTTVVTNLNADMVDGFHASSLTPVLSKTNDNAGTIVIGTPVYVKSNGNVDKARANALSTSSTLGIVEATSIATTAAGNIRFDGIIQATTGQWDTATGGSGGLTPGSIYYVSTTAGLLTTTAPSSVGEVVKEALFAISSTQGLILQTQTILL